MTVTQLLRQLLEAVDSQSPHRIEAASEAARAYLESLRVPSDYPAWMVAVSVWTDPREQSEVL